MKKSLALVGLLAIAGLGLGVLSGCHKDEPVDPDPTIVDNDGPQESDHDWVEQSSVDATCTEPGSVTYVCSICGETETEEIPALGHEWGNAVYVPEEEPAEDYWERVCGRCSDVEKFTLDEIPDGAVLAATSEEQLATLVAIEGVTVALSSTVDEETEAETPFEFTSALSVTGSDVTIVVEEGSSVFTASGTTITNSALITVAEGASLTLELGEEAELSGYAGTTSGGEPQGLLYVSDGGELVINAAEGSTVTQNYSAASVLTVDVGGKCTINGGDFTVTDATNYVVINDGELTINGGVFSTESTSSSLIISGDNYVSGHEQTEAPILTINGGIFQGGKHVIKNALEGELTITGGSFDGYKNGGNTSEDLIDNDTGHTLITGGVFGQATSDEVETGSYGVAITAKAPNESAAEYTNSVEITGGSFYTGTSGLFDIAENQSITISSSVYSEIKEHISEETFNVIDAGGTVLITPKGTAD